MKISIITVTYNAEKFLEKTILSVLKQNCYDFEYIIIDGNSTDETIDIIKFYEEKIAAGEFLGVVPEQYLWISEPDSGLYNAMNKGIDMAKGDFVWFMNAGDKIFDSNTLQFICEAIQSHTCDVVYGQSLIIDKDDKPLGKRHKIAPPNLHYKHLLNGLVVGHQSIIARRDKVFPYNLQYRISADFDWVIRLLKNTDKVYYIDDYLSRFMIAGISSTSRKKSWIERFSIMKKHFGWRKTVLSHLCIIVKYPFTKKY